MKRRSFFLTIFFLAIVFLLPYKSFSQGESQEKKEPIVVDGDKVEFFGETKEVQAEGNVVIVYQDAKLTCDKIKVNTTTKDAVAEGNVYLISPKGEIKGDRVEYNFDKKVGRIIQGHIKSNPFFGKGVFIDRVSENEFLVNRGFITTCDLDQPHYRFQAKKIEIFPGDKVIARNVILKVGNIPLFYIPKFVQRLDEKRPRVTVVPGKSKDWGYYLLQAWRYEFNDLIHGRFHLDYREKKDFAWGWDNHFNTPFLGEGLFRTYYMNERNIQSKHIYDNDRNTKERERFRIQLLQTKQLNDETKMVLQFNRMRDANIVKDYFFREYEKEYKPDSYLLVTHTKPYYNLSLLARKRFNRYFAETERLPEIKLNIPSYRIGVFDTEDFNSGDKLFNLYFKNETTSSNLENKGAAPSDLKEKIYRFDTYNELAQQKKLAFIETRPYVAFRETYFSKDVNRNGDIWREVFYTGIDLSTKFYRMFNASHESFFIRFHNLRHIITPSIAYQYIHEPTVRSSELISYDGIDSIGRNSAASLSLENKLQTKRNDNTVDFIRLVVGTSYLFRYVSESGGRFSDITSDLEFEPDDWIRIDADSAYDRRLKKISSYNLDFALHDKKDPDKWSIGIGKRYSRKSSNQITTEFGFRPNNKWRFRVYERFYPRSSNLIEQEYTVSRDLHCWELEFNYNVQRGGGETIWIILRLKAFPDIGFDYNKEYHRPKPGSQTE